MNFDISWWAACLSGGVLGLIFGSFVGMPSYRWPRQESWLPSSHCPRCQARLTAKNLIPVLSWLLQRGISGCCQHPISPRYLWIEGIAALSLALLGGLYGFGIDFVLLSGLVLLLLFITVTDLETGYVADGASLAVATLGLFWLLGHPPIIWWDPLLSLLQTAGIGLLLTLGYSRLRGRDMMGWGDVKLMAAAALWLPAAQVPIYLILASLLGLITGIIWRRIYKSDEFPFAPALSVSLLCTLFIAP